MKPGLEKNAVKMYSTHKERKSAVAEKFIRALKTKFINTRLQYQKM